MHTRGTWVEYKAVSDIIAYHAVSTCRRSKAKLVIVFIGNPFVSSFESSYKA